MTVANGTANALDAVLAATLLNAISAKTGIPITTAATIAAAVCILNPT